MDMVNAVNLSGTNSADVLSSLKAKSQAFAWLFQSCCLNAFIYANTLFTSFNASTNSSELMKSLSGSTPFSTYG